MPICRRLVLAIVPAILVQCGSNSPGRDAQVGADDAIARHVRHVRHVRRRRRGDSTPPRPPTPPMAIDNASEICAGGTHYSCAVIDTSDHVVCWGDGAPVTRVPGLTLPFHIACGTSHTCVVDMSHQVWCWGDGSPGELGNGMMPSSPVTTPVQVLGSDGMPLANANFVSAGDGSTCALISDGTVQCWGTIVGQPLATVVPGVTSIYRVDVGSTEGCAATSAQNVECWGTGYLGDNQASHTSAMPVRAQVAVPTSAFITDFLSMTSSAVTCADSGGTSYFWGSIPYLPSDGGPGEAFELPTSVAGLPLGATTLGATFGCVLSQQGQVICFGDDSHEQLGGSSIAGPTAVTFPVSQVQNIALGDHHACALTSSIGQVFCWGGNEAMQLGSALPGRATMTATPVAVPSS